MGQHQHIIHELAHMERIFLELAEESKVPGEAEALREMAVNYGRKAAKRAVVRTVVCGRRKAKRPALSTRLTGHPFRPTACPSKP
jgi:hypothetical protein